MNLKDFVPPIIFSIKRKLNPLPKSPYGWFGNFSSWDEAQMQCSGYDDWAILEKIISATNLVISGQAQYERDSIVFQSIEYSWPLLAGLLEAAATNNENLSVVDFGGSLGSTYYQNKKFFQSINVAWSIVEQHKFVEIGKKQFSTNLNFCNTIDEAIAINKKHVLILSSVIQYLRNPYLWIDKFLNYNFPYILIDRTSFINTDKERITIQRVPPEIYEASYPCYFFNEQLFLNAFQAKYELIADFPSYCDGDEVADDCKRLYWKGFIFKLK